jgi:hypothetical protein
MTTKMRACLVCLLALLMISCGGGSSSPPPPPPVTLIISPTSATVALNSARGFTATDSTGAVVAVNWTLNAAIGNLQPSGNTAMYTAPINFPTPNMVNVTATLQSDATKSASASVTIVYPSDNAQSEPVPIKLGTTGGNSTDRVVSGTTVTCCSGTLGSLLTRGGTLFILSNNHVLDNSDTGAIGNPISQPGLVDATPPCSAAATTTVANLSQAAPVKPIGNPGGLGCAGQPTPCGPAPNNVDAAMAAIVAGKVDTTGAILELGAAGPNSIAAAPPSSILAVPATVLAANEQVAKSGRTSGLTCSTLQSVVATVSVVYDSSCGGAPAFTSLFSNQVIVNGGNFSASGDSGSLIVTADTARPVALLYGGNSSTTSGNPIQDVLSALQDPVTHVQPSFVVNPDHAVSCKPTAINPIAPGGSGTQNAAMVAPQEIARATRARELYAAQLMQDLAVAEVSVGPSADNSREGAVVVRVTGALRAPIPAQLDGVRTRVIYDGVPAPRATVTDITGAAAIKEKHVAELFGQTGVQGVGVGVSDDNSAEVALVIYVDITQPRAEIPTLIEGLRTKIIEGDRFRAFNWGKEPAKQQPCSARLQLK